MSNTTQSLLNLFKVSTFKIPQYQRAYSWETDPHLQTFLEDLRQQTHARKDNVNKAYYLGTLLLHEIQNEDVSIVDGQQRLTTCVIFIAASLARHKLNNQIFNPDNIRVKELYRDFIYDDVPDKQKLKTITEDNPYFRKNVLLLDNADISSESPSALRLKAAFEFFLANVKDDEWEGLVQSLVTANVMVYSVTSHADATLIFELQNDRGKKLTDLESLKSYLMHLVYLHAKNPDDALLTIQTHFANIYRCVEKLDATRLAPGEDALLSYHCAAFLPWSNDEWRKPKTLVKQAIKRIDRSAITRWVLDFVATLSETYKTVTNLLDDKKLDSFSEFAQLVMLNRMATFWPLIIKTYHSEKTDRKPNFLLSCRLMEVYALRGGISKLRSDAGQPRLYCLARDFTGDFPTIHSHLYALSCWYDIPTRFVSGLNRASIYKNNRRDTQYILWRYENHLRSQTGHQVGSIPWKQYLFPANDATRLSIEHIAAQDNPISKTVVEWEPNVPKPFEEVATHRLGNLVLDSKSANSSKGKYDYSDKLESLSKDSTFLSQGQLIDWAVQDANNVPLWTVESVRKRHADLVSFATKTWDPSTYYKPQLPVEIVEDEEEQEEAPAHASLPETP